ncbi:D-arabinono-1,4-lactone oxidase [Prescottella agglutinans]|uniref:FAD-linked oxidoreductase n=1 Tax=Prescottella agglutinans TaxID=1644129 RepID=A0ABT6MBJ1_9NOCA|nr:D-arabinono-1,4-lactone oxidase [Prescottella agglutinans]MDH6281674.1 FAD-linked oxidoreductase [Prescottella agglutinans]
MAQDTWRNWAGTHSSTPQRFETPRSVAELSTLVAGATERGLRVKAVGAGHSFTGVAVTDGILVSLDNIAGIESVRTTPDGPIATVWAGTRLRSLNEQLWNRGLAMINLGDIDVQSIAGALSTGTHGTGARFGGLATLIRGLQIVLADGSVVDCSDAENPDLYQAAKISLGSIGIITKLDLAVQPRYAMRAVEGPAALDETLDGLEHDLATVDHFEFYWFPHTNRVLTKRNTRLPGHTPLQPVGRVRGYIDDELLSNTLFEGINRLTSAFPTTIPQINQISARALSAREFTDRSYEVFASPRRVRFKEMEYAVPQEAVKDTLREISSWLDRSDCRIAFPVEVRFAPADDVWLSTANGRDSAYIAVHQYHRRDHREYFDAVEAIARAVDGRPHWGKMHGRTAADLRPTYARFDEFCAVRDKFDPARTFDNEYLRQVLG